MTQLLGASWLTSLLGYAIGLLIEIDLYLKSGSPLPHTASEWIQFVIAIGIAVYGRITRQANVTSEKEGAK